MPILRVFPRKTNATPQDNYTAHGSSGLFISEDISEIYISVTFSLACSENHIRAVFDMLKRQKQRPEFSGGIEAKLLKSWHIDLFQQVKPKQIFFAYDIPDDLPPLEHAAHLFRKASYGNRSILRCYVLIGYPGDSFDFATKRLENVKTLSFCPMAMFYRNFKGETTREWRRFQRSWARSAAIYSPFCWLMVLMDWDGRRYGWVSSPCAGI